MILYSCISPQIKKALLLRGVSIGGTGALVLLITGLLFPLPILRTWGPWIFCSSLMLLAAGWYPYGQVRRLERSPHSIEVDTNTVSFYYHQRLSLTLTFEQIHSIEWMEERGSYGFVITTPLPFPKEWGEWVQTRLRAPVEQAGALFFPFFSHQSFEEWQLEQPDLPWIQHRPHTHSLDMQAPPSV